MNKDNGGGLKTRPSLFDIGLYIFSFCPIFFWMPWHLNMARGWFFVFGVLALLGLSFLSEKQVEYKNKFLGLIILWSLMNVFIHTFRNEFAKTTIAQWINYCMLSEGFIYVLCGCLLFYLVVSYAKNFKVLYPLLVINLLNLFFTVTQKFGYHFIWTNNHSISGMMGTCSQLALFSAFSVPLLGKFAIIPVICLFLSNSYTGGLALAIVSLFYFIYRKHYWKFGLFFVMTVSYAGLNYRVMFDKLMIRFEQWGYTLKEIIKSPVFGHGFDNTLNMNMIFSKLNGALTYRHNDYLNIGRDLGLVFLGFLVVGLWKILRKAKIDDLWCAVMIVVVGIFFQTNMYFATIASMAIILLALKERECLIF